MDINRILHRAYNLTRSYRALWIFGVLFALTSVQGGGGNGGGGGGSSHSNGAGGLVSKMTLALADPSPAAVAGIAVLLILLGLALISFFSAIKVVSETAMIRMVDGVETTGQRSGVGEGFRLGWSRAAWRIFLIDLLLLAGGLLFSLLLLSVTAAPLLLWLTQNEVMMVIGAGVSGLLALPVLVLILCVLIALIVFKEFFHRAAAIENQGVLAALRRGWQVALLRPGDTLLMGLALFAVTLGAALVMVPLFFIVAGAGAVVGGIPGLLVALVTSLFTQGAYPWLLGILVGLPIFLVIVMIPMLFTSGLVQVFSSCAWTLAYRDLAVVSK